MGFVDVVPEIHISVAGRKKHLQGPVRNAEMPAKPLYHIRHYCGSWTNVNEIEDAN